MLLSRTVPVLPSPSNQLRRFLFAAFQFPGGCEFQLLQFQQMDSFGSSARSHALPDSSCCGGDNEHLHNRDHNSDVVIVGRIPVYLNPKKHELKSLFLSSVNKCDDFELGRDKKVTSANELNSYHYDEFPPFSRQNNKRRIRIDLESEGGLKSNVRAFQVEKFEFSSNNSLPNQFGKKNEPIYFPKRLSMDASSKKSAVTDNLLPFEQPFDICDNGRGNAKPGAYWQVKGRHTVKEMKHFVEGTDYRVLRPGMVLLKHYITLPEQVNIVKTCQKLGLGPGGFYQPGYNDGAKLRLQMMCLGLDWDPQTRKYDNKRIVDGNKPPDIPPEFAVLVKKALKDAHALIKNKCNTNNVEDILPTMSPDICIVNFYTTSGRLGLHQDRDESKESLISGLPVVSFSIGNSAEFLYGDKRDIDKAEKVVLESGDVLIFGGDSRHIFHGVSLIIPNSTPKFLLNRTGLRPGRLNLTFRKY